MLSKHDIAGAFAVYIMVDPSPDYVFVQVIQWIVVEVRLVNEDLLLHLPGGSIPRYCRTSQARKGLFAIPLTELFKKTQVGAGHGSRPAIFENTAHGYIRQIEYQLVHLDGTALLGHQVILGHVQGVHRAIRMNGASFDDRFPLVPGDVRHLDGSPFLAQFGKNLDARIGCHVVREVVRGLFTVKKDRGRSRRHWIGGHAQFFLRGFLKLLCPAGHDQKYRCQNCREHDPRTHDFHPLPRIETTAAPHLLAWRAALLPRMPVTYSFVLLNAQPSINW